MMQPRTKRSTIAPGRASNYQGANQDATGGGRRSTMMGGGRRSTMMGGVGHATKATSAFGQQLRNRKSTMKGGSGMIVEAPSSGPDSAQDLFLILACGAVHEKTTVNEFRQKAGLPYIGEGAITIPSIHLVGISCEFKGISENLLGLFARNSSTRHIVYMDGGHKITPTEALRETVAERIDLAMGNIEFDTLNADELAWRNVSDITRYYNAIYVYMCVPGLLSVFEVARTMVYA